ncbi:MAG: dihydrofolate reductase [Pseudomonadota bacterium]|nr:dihydrofolate reductase [Pseudomonadota bacterium]
MARPTVCLIAAVARDGGIGHAGRLLVRIPEDLRRLKRLTLGSPVIMGRATWDSIGRPLPGRENIVITRNPSWRVEGAHPAASLNVALGLVADAKRVFIIGGAGIYALALPLADELELTEVDAVFPADTFFPGWNRADFRQTAREAHETADGLRYSFVTYRKV